MKTITKDILLPDWVNWIAQDESGRWYQYHDEPIPKNLYTGEVDGQWHSLNTKYMCQGPPNPNWQDTLEFIGESDE